MECGIKCRISFWPFHYSCGDAQALGSTSSGKASYTAAAALAEAAANAVQLCPATSARPSAGLAPTTLSQQSKATPLVLRNDAAKQIAGIPVKGKLSRADQIGSSLLILLRSAVAVLVQGGLQAPAVERFVARLLCTHSSLIR